MLTHDLGGGIGITGHSATFLNNLPLKGDIRSRTVRACLTMTGLLLAFQITSCSASRIGVRYVLQLYAKAFSSTGMPGVNLPI